uniref:Reverse transcriptase zinc-binding domain-containing protein n=1 Tax=Quercus lobata TaxID=97700 RepID=A0A7N2L616_QUELO
MDAELGSNPSYVWRSLLAAREILWEGSRWRVGDAKYSKSGRIGWERKSVSIVLSAKSAYRFAVRMKEQTRIEHSAANTERPIWRKLWKLNVPPKVRMFLGRACANDLPTKENMKLAATNLGLSGLCYCLLMYGSLSPSG